MTKAEFLAHYRKARAEWDEVISQIDPSRMTEPGVDGDYSIKDIIAHISWYERDGLGVMQTKVFKGSPYWDLPTQDERNAAIYNDIRNLSTSEVLTQSTEAYQQLYAALDRLTDADFNQAANFKEMPSDWVPAEVFASNTYEHYEQHLPVLRDWLNKP